MNSFSGNSSQKPSSSSSSSLKSYQFDFDLGLSGRSSSRPLKDQKPIPSAAAAAPSWTPQASKPSWTHQPAPRSGATAAVQTSMVGDIFGKSWGSPASAPAPASTARIGIPDKNPNLFGDLVGSALGKSGVGGNAPLKAAAAAAAPRSSYSMGSLSDNLPQSAATSTNNYPTKPSGNSFENLQNLASGSQSGIRSTLKGGQPVKSATGAGVNAKKDPFGSLLDFSSKPSGNPPLSSAKPATSGVNDPFGDFLKADFGKPAQSIPAPPASSSNSSASTGANFSFDGFGIPAQNFAPPPPQEQTAQVKSGSDPIDMLFASSASSAPAATASDINDWDVNVEFGGSGGGGEATTELDGLPPPPMGVTATSAKSKGLDNYKQGQYPDAVKWLTWAVVLSEKSGDSSAIVEILTCRASCYKEIGEYKKAVADCSKVLEHDGENVSVLLQRALLYENTEKYRLGSEDLRMVLKIDPGNRLARSTIHRLNKMAD